MSKSGTDRPKRTRFSTASTSRPHSRMSPWQERTLFVFLMLVLLVVIYLGVRA